MVVFYECVIEAEGRLHDGCLVLLDIAVLRLKIPTVRGRDVPYKTGSDVAWGQVI